ncbi:MAG: alkaline phosphatase family protein [Candidatus Izimaplasma sp.]|nr:alkaline phosphatase family protein [Candidatus Izimaplasma bacterium]
MNKNIVFPDYDHSLLSITSSILKHFNVKSEYKSLVELDKLLANNYRNVIFVLVDALGTEIIKKHLNKAEFLSEHLRDTLTTVFPSTTTSATTAALTGIPPVVSGWVGWQQFVKEEKRHVVFFMNKDYYDESYKFDYNVSDKFVNKTTIYELINKANPDIKTKEIFPKFKEEKHKTIDDQVTTCLNTIDNNEKNFIYMYWDQVDTKLHEFGTKSKEVSEEIDQVNKAMKRLFEDASKDSLIIVTADHGQVDIEPVKLSEYKDLTDMLEQKPAIEARATAFYVKAEYKDEFPKLFNKHFHDKFVLYKSEDLLKMNLFGFGNEHPKLREFLGDYFSIAIDKYAFNLLNKKPHKATHAGLVKDEMLIPLITNH